MRIILSYCSCLLIVFFCSAYANAQSYKEVSDSLITDYKSQPAFAYANDPAYWKEVVEEPSAFSELIFYMLTHNWVKWLFLILFSSLLIYAMVKMAGANRLRLFRNSGATNSQKTNGVNSPANFTDKIAAAVSAGDYRLAIRFHFLQTLQQLHEKNLIIYHQHGTNSEYLNQLKNKNAYPLFSQLAKIYEYAWYGEFKIDQQMYAAVAGRFKAFNSNTP